MFEFDLMKNNLILSKFWVFRFSMAGLGLYTMAGLGQWLLLELLELRNAEVRVLQIRNSTRTIHYAMQYEQLPISLM